MKNICSICGEEYRGWGNNARPINEGRCCDECNIRVVNERLKFYQKKGKELRQKKS